MPAFAATGPIRVAYGVDRAPAVAPCLSKLPGVLLHAGEALRLNSEDFVLPPPAIGQEKVATDIRLADHLKRLSGGWNRIAAMFIDGYFLHLRATIASHREEIARRLGPMAGLFVPEDVLYSAPLPLPRALLPLPQEGGATEHMPVDALLWLGNEAKAVLFAPSALMPQAERRRRERLAAAGIGVTVMTARDLAKPEAFLELLGARGSAFWQDEALPAAPGGPSLPEF